MSRMMAGLSVAQHRRANLAHNASAPVHFLWLAAAVLIAAVLLAAASTIRPARADDTTFAVGPLLTKCAGQTYALCAQSECTVFNGVAYCKCRVRHGTSISLTQHFDGQDVCDIMTDGVGNGFIVSTYSPPPQLLAPSGNLAVYKCTGAAASGAFAQCDGGLCFRSTQGQSFPGFDGKLEKDQLMCSCPIITATAASEKVGHEILGPYPCRQSWFRFCKDTVSNSRNASTLYVGVSTTRGFEFATDQFLGKDVPLKSCLPPG